MVHVSSGALMDMLTLGEDPSEVSTDEAEAVQPFEGSVTVTSYVPAALAEIDAVVALPPSAFHRYVPPPEAVRVSVGVAQVSMPEVGLMDAVGGVVLELITELAEAVQPLVVLVTVTMYVPATVAEIEAVVALPPVAFHKYVPPPVAVSVRLVTVQVSSGALIEILALGEEPSEVSTDEAEAVQPLVGSVTVTS